MGASDGFVIGLSKLVDHGPPTLRWNLVLVSEGYQAAEMTKFHQDANVFVDALFNTKPFGEMWCALNIYRLDVASTDSGADDPSGGSCTGAGTMARTYFDATFCSSGTPRLLTINDGLAQSTVSSHVPRYHVIVAIVNSTIYGGGGAAPGGPPVAAYSLGISPISGLGKERAGIHELGHSGFGLADEYPYESGNVYAGTEPFSPNVTKDSDKTTIKWKALLTTAQVPTLNNQDCSKEDPQLSPVPAGTVGAFEGAQYFHCGLFRPEFNCRMRELASPFCAVCAQTIRNTLQPYMAPASVAPTSPSIDFHNIPEGIGGQGVTTYRAIVFEVGSCTPVTLKVTNGPTSPFGLPLGSVAVVNPGQLTSEGRIWISYTSTTAGATASGTVTVQALETFESWVINITANTVARPKSGAVLVLDHSFSMSEDAGAGLSKVQKLREAVKTFVDVMLPGDGIGLVRFDDTAQIMLPIGDVATVGGTAKTLVDTAQFDPAGNTSIGDGMAKGSQSLAAAAGYAIKAMIILTDGMENRAPWIAQEAGSITASTFAVGLGVPSDIDVGKLEILTGGHQGYLLVSGALTQDKTYRLQKFFLQILAGITNANIVLDPAGQLTAKAMHRIEFDLTEADYGADIILLSRNPRLISFELETPDGRRIDAGLAGAEPNIQFVRTAEVSYYRIGLPALPSDASGTHAGRWCAVLRLAGQEPGSSARSLPYDLMVHSYSSLEFRATVSQSSYLPGTELSFAAVLTEYEVPVEGRAKVWADITRPDMTRTVIALDEPDPGRFTGKIIGSEVGLYTCRIRASGLTLAERPFTREQTLTAAILSGGTGIPGRDSTGCADLCGLVECLLTHKVIDPKGIEWLRKYGVRWEALLECFRERCGSTAETPRARIATKPAPSKPRKRKSSKPRAK